jgi:hypothetical protein
VQSSQAPEGPGEQEQPSPFAGLPVYPQHEEHASSAAPGSGDLPPPSYGAAVMRYEIVRNEILDDSGNLRFTLRGNGRHICDFSGYELAVLDPHPFSHQVDILRNGWVAASVHVAGLGAGGKFRVGTPAGQFAAEGPLLSHNCRLTGPGGDTVAQVTRQPGFRERLALEIDPGQDDVLLLAAILAIEDIRGRMRLPSS